MAVPVIFPTIEFAAFFLVVLTVSWWLMPRPRFWKPFMLVASYFFYGYTDPRFVLLLATSTLLNQGAAVALARRRDRRILVAAIVADLGLLGWFKYYGFFALSVDRTLSEFGLGAPMPLLQVALPIGISFFTFQAMSYVIDVWRGDTRPARLVDFAVYESFFPHLVAGPIVRAREFIPQLASPRDRTAVPMTRAVFLVCGGLTKKVVLADLLARRLVDPVFGSPGQHSSVEVLLAIYGYAAQIYCDFSAYSDIAIGVALLLGFRFPDNFDRPYAATSLRDFWRRWHITLSRWLRDYVYIPLGGSRRGPRRTQLNLLVTMVLGGLWHGAAWTFVLWGAVHGGGLAAERLLEQGRPRATAAIPRPRRAERNEPVLAPVGPVAGGGAPAPTTAKPAASAAAPLPIPTPGTAPAPQPAPRPPRAGVTGRLVRRLVTFHLVCAAWVLFRSPDLATAGQVFRQVATGGLTTGLVTPQVLAAIVVGLGVTALPARWWAAAQRAFGRLTLPAQVLGVVAYLLGMYSIVGAQDVAPFIYFRF
jgi:D-alanyl-lipoteichoic acid acyltransferase DltB (MBOAT superfamily)